MKKFTAIFFASVFSLVLPFSTDAQDLIPPLKANNILKYYQGEYDGTKIMPFTYIGSFPQDRLRFLRNEIFAKYGRPFVSRDLRDYFERTSWYAANPAYMDEMLTDTDRENVHRIQAMENPKAGLVAYLEQGNIVSDSDELLSAVFVSENSSNGIRTDSVMFSFAEDAFEEFLYESDFTLPVSIVKKGGYKSHYSKNAYFFSYKSSFYLVHWVSTGMHGEITQYVMIEFQYNSRTHTFSKVSFKGAY